MNTKDYLIQLIKDIEKNEKLKISDLIFFISTQSFNTKGQELEKFLFASLKQGLSKNKIEINLTENKKDKDIAITKNDIDSEIKGFSLKNYNPSRVQITTYSDFLFHVKEYKEKYKPSESFDQLDIDLIKNNLMNCFLNEISIITLFDKSKNTSGLYILNPDTLKNSIQKVSYFIAAENKKTEHLRLRVEYLSNNKTLSNFTIDFGTNPLNRGVWIEKMDMFSAPVFFEPVFVKTTLPSNYNKIDPLSYIQNTLNYLEKNLISS